MGTWSTCCCVVLPQFYPGPQPPSRVDFGDDGWVRSGAGGPLAAARPEESTRRDGAPDRQGGEGRPGRRDGQPPAEGHRPDEQQDRPVPGGRDAAQLAVGVHREGVADHLEHVHVGDRVAVGVALVEVVAEGRGEVLDRARLLLGVGVVVDVAGVAAVRDLHPRGDDAVGAEHLADRLDHLGARRRDDDDVATGRAVLLDQGHGLVVDERLDDRGQGLVDDVAHGRDVPAGAELRHELAHLVHLVVVGTTGEEDELGVRRAQHRAS